MFPGICRIGLGDRKLSGAFSCLRGGKPSAPRKRQKLRSLHSLHTHPTTSVVDQHLLAYASSAPIPSGRTKLDPRFDLVRRGSAPYVEWLGKADNPNGTGWAAPGNGYGASILKSLQEALSY